MGVFYDTEMFCSEIYKQCQPLELQLGVLEDGLGFSANPACCEPEADRKSQAAELFGEGALCYTESQTALQ